MTGALVGAGVMAGLLLLVAGWRAGAPLGPIERAVLGVPPPPVSAGWSLFAGPLGPALSALLQLAGGSAAIRRRLDAAGLDISPTRYLVQQITWAGLSGAVWLAAAAVFAEGPVRSGSAIFALLLGAVVGWLGRDWWLGRQVRLRRRLIEGQFPFAAELLALVLSAGASGPSAVEQVGRSMGGPLGRELLLAAGAMSAGSRFAAAMRDMCRRCAVPALDRFVDGLVAAADHGAPISDIARAQAVDARSEHHRLLMEAAGRKDVLMLLPVVFLVLPLVVVIALFPGAVELGVLRGA